MQVSALIDETLTRLNNPHIKSVFYELLSGKSLSALNLRKQRAVSKGSFDIYHDIGIAIELYKQNKFIVEKIGGDE